MRREEVQQDKQQRICQVTDAALKCFCEKGIERTTIVDIAKKAKVGEASVYRYFFSKENIVADCGCRFWEMIDTDIHEITNQKDYQQADGLTQVRLLMKASARQFEQHEPLFAFLHDFDAFVVSHRDRMDADRMAVYERVVDNQKQWLCSAIDKGKSDGSISCSASTNDLYYTLTHTILGLMQKLASTGDILLSDSMLAPEKKMTLLMSLLTDGLAYGCRKEER